MTQREQRRIDSKPADGNPIEREVIRDVANPYAKGNTHPRRDETT